MGLIKTSSEQFHQTVVMITHNEEIAQMAGRIIRLEDGKIAGTSIDVDKKFDDSKETDTGKKFDSNKKSDEKKSFRRWKHAEGQ